MPEKRGRQLGLGHEQRRLPALPDHLAGPGAPEQASSAAAGAAGQPEQREAAALDREAHVAQGVGQPAVGFHGASRAESRPAGAIVAGRAQRAAAQSLPPLRRGPRFSRRPRRGMLGSVAPPWSTPARRALSHAAGWLADRRIPTPFRRLVLGAFCAATGADPGEAQLTPVSYPSLNAFFLRRLKEGARPLGSRSRRAALALRRPRAGRGAGREGAPPPGEGRRLPAGRPPLRRGARGGRGGRPRADALSRPQRLPPRPRAPRRRAEEVLWVPGARFSVAPRVAARLAACSRATSARSSASRRSAAPSGSSWWAPSTSAASASSASSPAARRLAGPRLRARGGARALRDGLDRDPDPAARPGLAATPCEPGDAVRLGQALARRR